MIQTKKYIYCTLILVQKNWRDYYLLQTTDSKLSKLTQLFITTGQQYKINRPTIKKKLQKTTMSTCKLETQNCIRNEPVSCIHDNFILFLIFYSITLERLVGQEMNHAILSKHTIVATLNFIDLSLSCQDHILDLVEGIASCVSPPRKSVVLPRITQQSVT